MEIFYVLVSVLQAIGISLGVGCSTVAIVNFFVALQDGKIDGGERRIMGVTYILLRVAMGIILLSTAILGLQQYLLFGNEALHTLNIALWFLIVVLFTNAFLMTKHIMPSSFGPGIQASTWYTLGIITALPPMFVASTLIVSIAVWYVVFAAAIILLVYTLVKRMSASKKGKH